MDLDDLPWPNDLDLDDVPYMVVHYDVDTGVPTPLVLIAGAPLADEVLRELSSEDRETMFAAYPVLLVT